MWLEPYPTRFPSSSDLRRAKTVSYKSSSSEIPDWLTIVSPGGFPIEPIPGSKLLNNFVWRSAFRKAVDFAADDECTIVVGKPSVLALEILNAMPDSESLYDAMDDFPAFYRGFSRLGMKYRETSLAKRVDQIWASSTLLYQRWATTKNDVQLVYNGIDSDIVNRIIPVPSNNRRRVFGYIGTVGRWFDWELVLTLAHAMPKDIIRIIGPIFCGAPKPVPGNVEILPPCAHEQALVEMSHFDVGLIPFLRNRLTDSVDPIKYYEYRALGIPVLSTDFGEMSYRRDCKGVHIVRSLEDVHNVISQACSDVTERKVDSAFVEANSWIARFEQTGF